MKLDNIDIRLIEFAPNLRYKDGVIPPGRPPVWQFPLIAFHTDDGLVGHSMIYGPHGDGPAMADVLLRTYWPEIKGRDPRKTEEIWNRLMRKQRDLYNLSHALTGVVDVGLWDIRAQSEGKPICQLLGKVRDRMPCYASCRSVDHTPDEFAEEAARLKEEGFHGYKIQVFGGDPDWDASCLNTTRERLGDAYPVMIDMNGQLSLEDALTFGRVADNVGVHWIEEPCDESNLFAYQRLAQELKSPILAGETRSLPEMESFFHHKALNIARGDVLIKGGITGLKKLSERCAQLGYPIEIHTTNTPLLDVANLHVACSIEDTQFIENHHPIFRFALKDNPLEIDAQGYVTAPDLPGLGVVLDEDWIRFHTATQKRFVP